MLPKVWAMKRDELGTAVRRLLTADRDIQEHCLGGSSGDWQPPPAAADVAQALAASGGAAAGAGETADGADAGTAQAAVKEAALSAERDAAADADADASSSASEPLESKSSTTRRHGAEPDTALWGQLGEVIDGRRYAQWRAAEKELQQHFALLQAREAVARGIDALRAQQHELQERVEQLRRDPINQHLQLPPSLLLTVA